MLTREITSLQHDIVKHLVKLRTSKAYRHESQTLLISGDRLLAELSQEFQFKRLLKTKEAPSLPATETYLTTSAVLKKVTGVVHPENMAAEIALPPQKDLSGCQFVIVLDGIADPGNLGTLLRTAVALGWEGAFITENSADPFNDKALRAAKGATFKLPILQGSLDTLCALIENKPFQTYIADMEGKPFRVDQMPPPLVLIFGNESHGASSRLKARFPAICIPMAGQMESLNVAAAGAILMYAVKNR